MRRRRRRRGTAGRGRGRGFGAWRAALSPTVYIIGKNNWTIVRLKGASATGAATYCWETSGGRGYECTVCLSRGANKIDIGGGIEERILPCIRIIADSDHALRQAVYILFFLDPATIRRTHDGEREERV